MQAVKETIEFAEKCININRREIDNPETNNAKREFLQELNTLHEKNVEFFRKLLTEDSR